MADMVEAVIAALYLDSGLEQARNFIVDKLLSQAEISAEHRSADYKTELQIYCQKHGHQTIKYEIIAEHGPDHDKSFSAQVCVDGKVLGTGEGHTKKQAQIQAARSALVYLEENGVL